MKILWIKIVKGNKLFKKKNEMEMKRTTISKEKLIFLEKSLKYGFFNNYWSVSCVKLLLRLLDFYKKELSFSSKVSIY